MPYLNRQLLAVSGACAGCLCGLAAPAFGGLGFGPARGGTAWQPPQSVVLVSRHDGGSAKPALASGGAGTVNRLLQLRQPFPPQGPRMGRSPRPQPAADVLSEAPHRLRLDPHGTGAGFADPARRWFWESIERDPAVGPKTLGLSGTGIPRFKPVVAPEPIPGTFTSTEPRDLASQRGVMQDFEQAAIFAGLPRSVGAASGVRLDDAGRFRAAGPASDRAVGFEYSRDTAFRDGGLQGAGEGIDDVGFRGYLDDDGEFDLTEVDVRWRAAGGDGPVALNLRSGVRSIKADVSERRASDSGGGYSVDRSSGTANIPTIGGELLFRLDDGYRSAGTFFSTSATTHAFDDGGTYFDVTAEAVLQISPTFGFRAGYQYIRSELDTSSLDASLTQDGVFARFTIKF